MKFVCDNCHAQYVINDEKVGPNGVSVKCKKCQHKIVVKRPAPVEEDRASTIVMQNPIAQESEGSDAPTEPVTTQPPVAADSSGPSIPLLTPVGTRVPMTPFETGPTHGAFDDDIGRAFDSVMTAPGVANPLAPNTVSGSQTVEMPSSPWDAPPPGATGDASGDRDSTRVVDLTNLAGLTAQSAESDKANDAEKRTTADGPAVSEWYVAIDEEQVGPMTVDGVKSHWEKGELSADSLVWKTGMGDWKPLSSVPELAHIVVPVPRPQLDEKKEPPAGATAVGAQAAAPGVGAAPGADTDWKPSAATALASLVKEELEALHKPPQKPEPEAAKPAAAAIGGLLELPEDPAAQAEPQAARSSFGEMLPPPEPSAPIAERTLPRREQAVPQARAPIPPVVAPSQSAPPAARSNGAFVALGIGGGLLGVGAIVAVLFMTVLKPTPATPEVPTQPAPVAVAPPVAPPAVPAQPVGPPQPPPVAAEPETAAPAASAEAAAPEPAVAEAKDAREPPVEAKKEEKAPEPAKVEEPEKKEPTKVATRDRKTTTTRKEPEREPERAAPPPPPRQEVAVAPSRSKVDDDFERIFGGGGSSDPAPAPKEEKKGRTAYVPPPAGSATRTKLEQSDIMEVVVGNKSAIKRCVDEQKSKDPGASGTIVMRWSIKPDGRTANIQTMTSEFRKTPMSSCMAAAIKGWKFPTYSGAQMQPIDFPFKF